MSARFWKRLYQQMTCVHWWEQTRRIYFHSDGPLVAERCTRCGAKRWRMG